MTTNEIKSILITVNLQDYLEISGSLQQTKFRIHNHEYFKITPEEVIIKQDGLFVGHTTVFGKSISSTKYITDSKYGIIEYNGRSLFITKQFVLKEQIKNLKYVEQLNLFEDGEKGID